MVLWRAALVGGWRLWGPVMGVGGTAGALVRVWRQVLAGGRDLNCG